MRGRRQQDTTPAPPGPGLIWRASGPPGPGGGRKRRPTAFAAHSADAATSTPPPGRKRPGRGVPAHVKRAAFFKWAAARPHHAALAASARTRAGGCPARRFRAAEKLAGADRTAPAGHGPEHADAATSTQATGPEHGEGAGGQAREFRSRATPPNAPGALLACGDQAAFLFRSGGGVPEPEQWPRVTPGHVWAGAEARGHALQVRHHATKKGGRSPLFYSSSQGYQISPCSA